MLSDFGERYRGRFVLDACGPARQEDLALLEAEIGARLPADYRAFIERINGGELHYAMPMPPGEDGDPVALFDLYTLSPLRRGAFDETTLLGHYREAWFDADRLPIARDQLDNTLLLDLRTGEISADIDLYRGDEMDFRGVVAANFDEYLTGLVLDSESAADLWELVAGEPPNDDRRQAYEEWFDQDIPGWRTHPWAVRPPPATTGGGRT